MIAWLLAVRRGQQWWCARCDRPLVIGQPVDADHFRTRPPSPPDRLAHASCNRGKRLLEPSDAG
jgi:hypothetical protein